MDEDAPVFEWDEAKRQATLAKHGIDFIDAVEVFSGEHVVLAARSEIEERRLAVGQLGGATVTIVFTIRGGNLRLITARRARRNEREHYHTHVHRGNPQA